MKNFLYILTFFISASVFSQQLYRAGQSNLLNAKNPEDIGIRTAQQIVADEQNPLEYGIVDDKDILWSVIVWEVIDLDERVNFPLLYPVDTSVVGPERRPMFWWLKQEILKGNLDVYDQGVTDGEFRNKIEEEDIINLFRERQVLEPGKDAVRDVGLWIEEVVSAQLATLPVDPYSGEEIPEEYQAVLDTVDLVFPFTIKGFNDADAPYTQLQEDLFTYEMFQGYMQDPPVRVVLPEGGETELKEEEIDEYKRALNEYMVEELWVEDKHFYWADLKYYLQIHKTLNTRMNAGIAAVVDLLCYDIKSLHIKGFTFFKDGWTKEHKQEGYKETYDSLGEQKEVNHSNKPQVEFLDILDKNDTRITLDKEVRNVINNWQ